MAIRTKISPLGNIDVITEVPWSQTLLSGDGVVGGSACACTSSAVWQNTTGLIYNTFRAFNGNPLVQITIGSWGTYNACVLASVTGFITYYTPTPIKISSVSFMCNSYLLAVRSGLQFDGCSSRPTGASIYASNDNINWTFLKTGYIEGGASSGVVTSTCTISNISCPDFYKYIKIQSLGGLDRQDRGVNFAGVTITATKRNN